MFQVNLDELRQRIDYNPLTGVFTWLKQVGRIAAGSTAGCRVNVRGKYYSSISVNNQNIWAHRLAWFYMYGVWPEQIDHIDGDGFNNRLANLRDVSALGNSRNHRLANNNTSGTCGVHYHKRFHKWYASIKVQGKRINLGSFSDKQDAIAARQRADKLYNFHPNHGLPKAVFLVS